MVDYSKLSDEDLLSLKNGAYENISDDGLKVLASENNNEEEIPMQEPLRTKAEWRNWVTPSGAFNRSQDVVASLIATPMTASRKNVSLPEAYNENIEKLSQYRQDNPTPIRDLAVDTAVYSLLPAVRGAGIGSRALTGLGQGAVIGGLEALQNDENLLKGTGLGATIGATMNATLPPIAKGISKALPTIGNVYAKSVARLTPDTIKQLIKPGSKALDLDSNTAQQLLTDTTMKVRKAYNNLLEKKGNKVGEKLSELPNNTNFTAQDLMQDYDKIYDKYSLSKNDALNPARRATKKEMQEIENMLNDPTIDREIDNTQILDKANNKVSPKELYDINKNISNMIQWNKPEAAMKNDVLEQIYGSNAERISNLSPELKQANKDYSDLMDFKKNEGVLPILRNGEKLDAGSSSLKNYKGNITQGNRNRNITDLENKLVSEGEITPFLNDIDDVNAAQNLLQMNTTGDSIKANVGGILARPVFKGIRAVNRKLENLPDAYIQLGQKIPDSIKRLLTVGAIQTPLQGNISYNDYIDNDLDI